MATLQLVNAFDGSLTSICSGFGPTRPSGPAARGYPPAVCGSGAAVAEVHPPERCCWKRPFSSHIRSRRPWSDFLRSSLTFRFELWLRAVGCVSGQTRVAEPGSQNPGSSAGPGITVRILRQSENKRAEQTVWLQLVQPRRALQGCSLFPGARVNGDVNAPLMRFPETPQDQWLLRWQSEIWQLQVK